MLPHANRLRRSKDFRRLYSRGKTVSGPTLIFRYVGTQETQGKKIGIVVGTRVSKRAVVRNLLRRRLREAIRPLLKNLPNGFEVIIVARPTAAHRTFAEIVWECTEAMRRVARQRISGPSDQSRGKERT